MGTWVLTPPEGAEGQESFSTDLRDTAASPSALGQKRPRLSLRNPFFPDTPAAGPGQPSARQARSLLCDFREVAPPLCAQKS